MNLGNFSAYGGNFLAYGISGLGLALAILSFRLLQKERLYHNRDHKCFKHFQIECIEALREPAVAAASRSRASSRLP
jgi:hypothetical protein